MQPKFIYFDVGGVLLLDFSGTNKWIEMRRALGVTAEKDEVFDKLWGKYHQRICLDYPVDNFISELERKLGLVIHKNYSMLADFVNRFTLNTSIWPIVEKISQKYQVGLLTNMYLGMLALIQKQNLIPPISWDVVVDSSKVGYQKPDKEIFVLAKKLAGVKPAEILFIDNTAEHLEAAQKRGWQTLWYDTTKAEESNQQLIKTLSLA
ncbi:MAG: HAD family hydrolase [Candidatus Pacebacteria bacterium]|nr:HAD family hydrolase [Candidatus Paceibacterota bacterium]